MARILSRVAQVVAAGLLLGSCAAATPWSEWRETAALLDAPGNTDAISAHTDARIVRAEQLFDN
jgi:hypothetical protein